jgi:lipopolysaccharide export system protein LptA
MRRNSLTAAFIMLAVLCSAVYAERITFSADSMSGTAGDTSDSTSLTGNAYVLTSSMEISADSITMSGKNFRYITAKGNITGKNIETKMEFKCGSMAYDRETKIATLRDNVHLDDTENKVSADAQIIEYNQNTDIAIIQIGITLKQKDNVCSGAYAVYRKKDQMLELSGNSQVKQGEDTFRAQEITLDLNTQEITLDGRVKGSVVDDKSTKDDAAGTTDKPEDTAESPAGTADKQAETADKQAETADKQAETADSPADSADNTAGTDGGKQ